MKVFDLRIIVFFLSFCFINIIFSQNLRRSDYQISNNRLFELARFYEAESNFDSCLYYYQELVLSFDLNGNIDSSFFYHNEITRVLIENDSLERANSNLIKTKEFIKIELTEENANLAYWYFLTGQIRFKKENFQESLLYYDSSLNIIDRKKIADKKLKGDIYSHKGLSCMELFDYEEALMFFRKSLIIYELNVNQFYNQLITTYSNISNVLENVNKIDSSNMYLIKALNLSRRFDNVSFDAKQTLFEELAIYYMKSDMIDSALYYIYENIEISKNYTKNIFYEGQSYNLLGIIYHRKGEYFKSIDYYKQNIHIYDSAFGKMHINSAHPRENLGTVYNDLMDFDSSAKYLEGALTIRLKNMPENSSAIGNSYLNLGNMHYYKNDPSQALKYYKKATSIYIKTFGEEHIYVSYALGNTGVALINLGENKEALVYLKKAESAFGSSTRNLLNIGIAYARLKNFDSAQYYLELCLEKRLEMFSVSHPDIASTYYHLGLVYKEMCNYSKSLQYYLKAAEIFKDCYGGNHNQIALCYLSAGEIFQKDFKYINALKYYQKGLSAIAPGFKSDDIYKNPDMSNQKILMDKTFIDLIKAKAEVFYKKNHLISHNKKDLEESYKLYTYCIKQIPEISREYKNEATRLKLYDDYSNIYTNVISIHFELFGSEKLDDAFSISEKGKSQLLFESIMESLALSGANIDENIKIKERQLRQKINLTEDEILGQLQNKDKFDSLEFSKLEDRLFDLKLEYDRIKENLEINYKDYYDLKYETSVAGITDIQDNLTKNQAIIEYSLGDSALFAFAITKENSFLKKIPIDSTFIILIEEYRKLNLKEQLETTDWRNYLNKSFHLYSILLKPLDKKIKNKELIIIPDKEIGYIPFETLITGSISSDKINYADLPWLIKSHPISYAYSATLYINSKNKVANKNEMEVLAFAPFSKEQNSSFDQNTISLLRERGVEEMELTGASNEVKAISEFYTTDIYFDSTATEKMFWEKSANYNIIHIASHGIIDDEKPSYSKLLFHNNTKDSLNDGEVHTYELFEKQLNAQLVVLSACNTGMGKIHKGEGVMSLARGFLYTGIPSIIMTLWSVDDRSSAELIKYFYKYLWEGDNKNIALQKAKIDYLRKTKNPDKLHPRYWAGYVLIGDESALIQSKFLYKIIIISFLIILSIFIFVFVKKSKRY